MSICNSCCGGFIPRELGCIPKSIETTENISKIRMILTKMRGIMFRYEKEIFEEFRIEQENIQDATLLQEMLGPVNFGLKMSIQYMTQALKIEDAILSELLFELSAEMLSKFELFSRVIKALSGSDSQGIMVKSQLNESVLATGDPCTDLLSDIASEQQMKLILEGIHKSAKDQNVQKLILKEIEYAENRSLKLREAFNKIQRTKVKADFKTSKQSRMCFGTIKPVINENSYDEFKKTAPAVLGGRD